MSNHAKVRKPKGKWASDDDAGSLLAGILDETEEDALAEQQRLEEELKRKEEEEARRKEEEEYRKLQEAEARLQSEHQRQEALKVRRTEKMEALRIEDLKARGEWVEPEKPAAPEPVAEEPRQVTAADLAAAQLRLEQHAAAPVVQHAPTPEASAQGSNRRMGPMLAIVMALVVAGAGITFGVVRGQYKADTTQYARTVIEPSKTRTGELVASVQLVEEEAARPSGKPTIARPTTSSRQCRRGFRRRRGRCVRIRTTTNTGTPTLDLGNTDKLLAD